MKPTATPVVGALHVAGEKRCGQRGGGRGQHLPPGNCVWRIHIDCTISDFTGDCRGPGEAGIFAIRDNGSKAGLAFEAGLDGSPWGTTLDIRRQIIGWLLAAAACAARTTPLRIAGLDPAATSIGDGGPATLGKLVFPVSVALDPSGNLYIADLGQMKIRKVTPAGIITTVAGNGGFQSGPTGCWRFPARSRRMR